MFWFEDKSSECVTHCSSKALLLTEIVGFSLYATSNGIAKNARAGRLTFASFVKEPPEVWSPDDCGESYSKNHIKAQALSEGDNIEGSKGRTRGPFPNSNRRIFRPSPVNALSPMGNHEGVSEKAFREKEFTVAHGVSSLELTQEY